jgi:hypothetical protein
MSWFMWPSEIKQFEQGVYDAYESFSLEIAKQGTLFTGLELEKFRTLYIRFITWHNGLHPWSYGSGSVFNIAEDFGKQLRYWRDLYNARSPVKSVGPGVDLIIPSPEESLSRTLKYVAVSAGITVSLASIAKILRG